jgi:hypothetical protein
MLITKKDPNALIDNPIAAIFKGHNLFEFKSPTDYLSVTDFYKGLAYGFSYKSLYGADIHDITFSFVVPYYPREVMKEIRGIRGYRIGKGGRGITLISCALGMEMQLIEAKKLSAESNVFLRHLRNDLSAGD